MDEKDKAVVLEAMDSAKKNGITPTCFEPNDAVIRLVWYCMMWLLDEWGLK